MTARASSRAAVSQRTLRRRMFVVAILAMAAFGAVTGQLVRFGVDSQASVTLAVAKPLGRSWARPDIVDRQGRLLATDIVTHSIFADPSRILDVDEVMEQLVPVLKSRDVALLRSRLEDRSRRFLWLKRGVTPGLAQRVHNLGLPGVGFRNELRRVYPAGPTVSHVVGFVNIDNLGQSGIEKFIDDRVGITASDAAQRSPHGPVRLTIDLGVQHVLRSELLAARERFGAKAAAGVVLDVNTGAIVAASSVPDFDPNQPEQSLDPDRLDRLTQGRYELGSVFKAVTLAIALDLGTVSLATRYDARRPLKSGGYVIDDFHPLRRWLRADEVFLKSSNIGAALMAIEIGEAKLKAALERFGLSERIETEAGLLAAPKLPDTWRDTHTMTIGYGHGIAVAPLQFAGAVAAIVNGGRRVYPQLVATGNLEALAASGGQIIRPQTSAAMRRLFRRNVLPGQGTGRQAAVPGYQVGGKTGTADQPGKGGYGGGKVISSFVSAFPMGAPRYLTYVLVFEPQAGRGRRGTSAGVTAAPTTARIIQRIAPMLGIAPQYRASEG